MQIKDFGECKIVKLIAVKMNMISVFMFNNVKLFLNFFNIQLTVLLLAVY